MTTLPDVLAVFDTAELVDELARRGVLIEATVLTHPVVELPGLTVAPGESRVRYRGVDHALVGRPMEVVYALALARWQGRLRLRADVLAAKVWRGWMMQDSAPSLRSAVFVARRKIPDLVGSRTGTGYWLNLDAAQTDAA